MKTSCDWCRCDSGLASRNPGLTSVDTCVLCPLCIIQILPKTLELEGIPDDELFPSGLEKRRQERLPVYARVYLAMEGQSADVTEILLLDVSEAGMKIRLQKKLLKDESITLGFMTRNVVYKAIGVVRHITEISNESQNCFEAGIELTGIHQDVRR